MVTNIEELRRTARLLSSEVSALGNQYQSAHVSGETAELQGAITMAQSMAFSDTASDDMRKLGLVVLTLVNQVCALRGQLNACKRHPRQFAAELSGILALAPH